MKKRPYAITNNKYNYYIFMEEAICNTFSYGSLGRYLMCSLGLTSEECNNILQAFGKVMKNSPRGYRDFIAISDSPKNSRLFQKNVAKLMIEIYGATIAI